MSNDHWFDTLNKLMVEPPTRRGFLLATFAAIAGLLVGVESDAEAAPNRKKNSKRNTNRNRKKNKQRNKKPRRRRKPKPKPKQPAPTCSAGICQNQWSTPDRATDAASCEITCARCKRTNTDLCILEGDPTNPEKVADCCGPCELCVGDQCVSGCPSSWECCEGTCCPNGRCCPSSLGSVCAPEGAACCAESPNGWCPAGQECCPGVGCSDEPCECADSQDPCCDAGCDYWGLHCCPHPGFTGIQCVQLDFDRDNCGSCGNQCPPSWGCCDGACVDLSSDPRYCSACNWHCQPGQVCDDRFCRWPA